MKKIFLLAIIILAAGCAHENPLQKAMSESINYSTYSEDGFSISYPDWPLTEGGAELTASRGYCTVSVNTERMQAKQWYSMMLGSVNSQSGTIISSDEEELSLEFSLLYQNITFISSNRIFQCNDKAAAVTISCIKDAESIMQNLSHKIFPSADCQEEEIIFKEYEDGDFSMDYPDWDDIPDNSTERMLGKTRGVCSLLIDRHNALPKDIIAWLKAAMEAQESHQILSSSENSIRYRFPFADSTLTAKADIIYCNYQSYIVQALCADEYATDDDWNAMDSILKTANCAREYEIPTPQKTEGKKEEIKTEEPEIIEEIEDEIVRTHAGDEFGIDEEMVVYFINNNAFFTKVLSDFSRANLRIEDGSRQLKLKVKIDDDGKITRLEDGEYDDADVTLIIPLRDALNIFSNAENLNPINLLSFAINVRTEPADIKNRVIQKTLTGGYN